MTDYERRELKVRIALAVGKLPKALRGDLFDRNPQVRDPAMAVLTELVAEEITGGFEVQRKDWSGPGPSRHYG